VSELAIRNQIMAALKSIGAYAIVTTGVSEAGTPDIIGCLGGRFFALEVKDEKGRVSKIQEARLRKIRRAGGVGAVVRSRQDALVALDPNVVEVPPMQIIWDGVDVTDRVVFIGWVKPDSE
jgi:Holliday junction resolvase